MYSSSWCCYTLLSGPGVTAPFGVPQSAGLHVLGTETARLLPPSGQDPDVDDRPEDGHGQAGCADPDPCHLEFPAIVLVFAVHAPLTFSGLVPAHDLRSSLEGCGRRSLSAWAVSTGGPPGAVRACGLNCAGGERFSPQMSWRVAPSGCVVPCGALALKFWGIFGVCRVFRCNRCNDVQRGTK